MRLNYESQAIHTLSFPGIVLPEPQRTCSIGRHTYFALKCGPDSRGGQNARITVYQKAT